MKASTLFLSSLFTSLLLLSNIASAWELDSDTSVVSFVTIKKESIGEAHTFKKVAGSIKDNIATIAINPDSVETNVPIRNQRMSEFLFETAEFPSITISADVEAALASLEQGSPQIVSVPASLSLHGVTADITLDAYVSMIGESTLSVVSSKPAIVKAVRFNLTEGITKLSSLVNDLPIAQSVPVSFALTFKK